MYIYRRTLIGKQESIIPSLLMYAVYAYVTPFYSLASLPDLGYLPVYL